MKEIFKKEELPILGHNNGYYSIVDKRSILDRMLILNERMVATRRQWTPTHFSFTASYNASHMFLVITANRKQKYWND